MRRWRSRRKNKRRMSSWTNIRRRDRKIKRRRSGIAGAWEKKGK